MVSAITAFWPCRRFPASSYTTLGGPSRSLADGSHRCLPSVSDDRLPHPRWRNSPVRALNCSMSGSTQGSGFARPHQYAGSRRARKSSIDTPYCSTHVKVPEVEDPVALRAREHEKVVRRRGSGDPGSAARCGRPTLGPRVSRARSLAPPRLRVDNLLTNADDTHLRDASQYEGRRSDPSVLPERQG